MGLAIALRNAAPPNPPVIGLRYRKTRRPCMRRAKYNPINGLTTIPYPPNRELVYADQGILFSKTGNLTGNFREIGVPAIGELPAHVWARLGFANEIFYLEPVCGPRRRSKVTTTPCGSRAPSGEAPSESKGFKLQERFSKPRRASRGYRMHNALFRITGAFIASKSPIGVQTARFTRLRFANLAASIPVQHCGDCLLHLVALGI